MTNESKNHRFQRLARQRGEKALRQIDLISNLSNKNNYDYSDEEVKALFRPIEEALRDARQGFVRNKKRSIDL